MREEASTSVACYRDGVDRHDSAPWAMIAKFAWPAAVVVSIAMILAYLQKAAPQAESRIERRGSDTVLQEVRALARLETTTLHLEKVLDMKDHQTRAHGLVGADDALLYVAVGEVVLGVDLAKVDPTDLRIDPSSGTAYLELPPPEVLSVHLDEAQSHVHSRSTDLLARRNEGLEGAARREALTAFAAAARDPHADAAAKATAEKVLRSLAKGWGAKELVVTWKPSKPEVELPKTTE